jgi:Domain of unknown function (DUF3387)/HsdM N-terminal domain/N-6 DNA Methylase
MPAKSDKAPRFESILWSAADKLRGNLDAAEYKHVVLGLIFLKYISDAFEEKYAELKADKGADPEDRDEYLAENIFWVPPEARWSYLQGRAKDPLIGKLIDNAMIAIERDNASLKNTLPKDYARPHLDKQRLGELIDLIGKIGLGDKESRSKDILGRVYEYFLSQFASAEGKKGGQFYTPRPVDYLGLAHELKQALAVYTESGGHGDTAIDQEEAVAVMLEKYEICRDFFHGFDHSRWLTGTAAQRLSILPAAQEHILKPDNGESPDDKKRRYVQAVTELSKAFALAVPHEKAIAIRDDVGFFQAVRAALAKNTPERTKSPEEMDLAIRQLVSEAVSSDEVIDIFAAAGLKRPDISILSEEFLRDVRGLPQKNVAVELLRKLLNNEIKVRSRTFLIQSRSFSEMLEAGYASIRIAPSKPPPLSKN